MKFCLASVICSLIVAASAIPLSSPTSTAFVAVSTNFEKRQGLLKGALGALKHTLRGAPEAEQAADGLLLSIDDMPTSTAFTGVPADLEKRQDGSGLLGELDGAADNVLTGGSQAGKAADGLLAGLLGGLGRRAQTSRDMAAFPTPAEQLQESSDSSVDISPRAPADAPPIEVVSDVDEGEASSNYRVLRSVDFGTVTGLGPVELESELTKRRKNPFRRPHRPPVRPLAEPIIADVEADAGGLVEKELIYSRDAWGNEANLGLRTRQSDVEEQAVELEAAAADDIVQFHSKLSGVGPEKRQAGLLRRQALVTTSDKEGEGSEFDEHLVDAEVIITTPFHPGYLTKERLAKAKNLKTSGDLARHTPDSKLSKRQGQKSGSFIEDPVEDTVELVMAFEEKFGVEIAEDETGSGPEKRQSDLEQTAELEATTADGVVKRKGPPLKSRDLCDASVLSIEKTDPDFESFNPVPRSESPNREAHLVASINVKCDSGSSKPLESILDSGGEKRQLLQNFNITIELDKDYLPLSFEVNHPTPERRATNLYDLDGHPVGDTGLKIANRDPDPISSGPVPTLESTKREAPSTMPDGGLGYYDVSLVDGFNVPDSFTGGVLDTKGAFKIGASVPRAVEASEANSRLGQLVQYIQYGGVALEKVGEDLTGGLVPVA